MQQTEEQGSWLDVAVKQGVITDAQRAQLSDIQAGDLHHTDSEEKIKPISTLNELFVTFGIIILTSAISGILSLLFAGMPVLARVIAAVITLYIAYRFYRQGKYQLAMIYCVLRAAFHVGVFTRLLYTGSPDFFTVADQSILTVVVPLAAALGVLVACCAYFRLAFLILPIGVLFTIIISLAAKQADNNISHRILLAGSGLMILAFSIWMDLQDKTRTTRQSDYAFWGYVAGSPLFVHALMLPLIFKHLESLHGVPWVLVTLLVLLVTIAGILMNRRALILSTLIYVSVLIVKLFGYLSGGGAQGAYILSFTALIIGVYVLVLGLKWAQVRSYVLIRLEPHCRWVQHLPNYR